MMNFVQNAVLKRFIAYCHRKITKVGNKEKCMLGLPIATTLDVFRAVITSAFGYRTHPITGRPQFHNGVDVAFPEGTAVVAPADGVVVGAGEDELSGKKINIQHDGYLYTAYAHLSRIDVSIGQQVVKGQQIGAVGMTGRATGPHLHFGTYKVDPGREWKMMGNRKWLNPLEQLGLVAVVGIGGMLVLGTLAFVAYKLLVE